MTSFGISIRSLQQTTPLWSLLRSCRQYHISKSMSNVDFQPITGSILPRFAGLATLLRLPALSPAEAVRHGVDIGLIGVPYDGGTTNRPGARHGPRSVRDISTTIRNVNRATGVNPFQLCNCADLGDAPVNPISINSTLSSLTSYYQHLASHDIVPLSVGGDHLITLPILRGLVNSPVALIQFDAHSDTWDSYFNGETYTHGTVFRRAIEEQLIQPQHMIQIGLRGALYADALDTYSAEHNITVVDIDAYHQMGVARVCQRIREVVGDLPVYVTFDIDVLDPVFAPGTGTPEIGGISSYDAQQLLRGLRGLRIIGADVVEVAPQYDPTSNTSLAAATLMYELLCVIAESKAMRKKM